MAEKVADKTRSLFLKIQVLVLSETQENNTTVAAKVQDTEILMKIETRDRAVRGGVVDAAPGVQVVEMKEQAESVAGLETDFLRKETIYSIMLLRTLRTPQNQDRPYRDCNKQFDNPSRMKEDDSAMHAQAWLSWNRPTSPRGPMKTLTDALDGPFMLANSQLSVYATVRYCSNWPGTLRCDWILCLPFLSRHRIGMTKWTMRRGKLPVAQREPHLMPTPLSHAGLVKRKIPPSESDSYNFLRNTSSLVDVPV